MKFVGVALAAFVLAGCGGSSSPSVEDVAQAMHAKADVSVAQYVRDVQAGKNVCRAAKHGFVCAIYPNGMSCSTITVPKSCTPPVTIHGDTIAEIRRAAS